MSHEVMARPHGGPDAAGAVRWDFSSNANAVGPCPAVQAALAGVDASRYPDPAYTGLRQVLAEFHGVDAHRIVMAASASEAISRLSAWAYRSGSRRVWMPEHAYGDYAHFARQWLLESVKDIHQANLVWWCNPGSPEGQVKALPRPVHPDAMVVLDCAYRPLCLEGSVQDEPDLHGQVWRLWTPNKALGLTGIRGAYLVAPDATHGHVATQVDALNALAPTWCVGAHAQTMLSHWTHPGVQAWLQDSLQTLQAWKRELVDALAMREWSVLPSHTNFVLARPPRPWDAIQARRAGVQLRDATSFGWPGWWRLSAQAPEALAAWKSEWDRQCQSAESGMRELKTETEDVR